MADETTVKIEEKSDMKIEEKYYMKIEDNYFLFCKDRYQALIKNIQSIINEYDHFIQDGHFSDSDSYEFQLSKHLDSLKSTKNNVDNLLHDLYENKLKYVCNHDFEHDMIDLTPDRSQNITYCKICGYQK